MKCAEKDLHILRILKKSKCKKVRKGILKQCDDSVIQTLSEIVHNILNNDRIKDLLDSKTLNQLRKHKTNLRKINSVLIKNKNSGARRKVFINQEGGFWGPLLTTALSALAEYGINKLISKNSAKTNE